MERPPRGTLQHVNSEPIKQYRADYYKRRDEENKDKEAEACVKDHDGTPLRR